MVTFTHDGSGTPEALWRTDAGLDLLPVLDLPARLVVLAAHPDDETLGAGGLLATAGAAGVPAHVVVASAGEASHPRSTTHGPQRLAAIRRREVRAAVSALHPAADLTVLDLPDGGLAHDVVALERAVRAAVLPSSVPSSVLTPMPSSVLTAPRPVAPAPATLVAPWRGDEHPDHAAVGHVAARLAREAGSPLWEYPVWAWHWARPGDPRLPWRTAYRFPLDAAARRAKAAAGREHVSQVEPLSQAPGDEVLLGPDVLAHFDRDVEIFFVGAP